MIEKTLSIIKPDAVRLGYSGKIIALIETAGFKILGLSMVHMTQQQAQRFYDVHREKPFFNSLTEFMSSGPSIVMVIEKENAIEDLRKLMGATDPANACEGTLRKAFASSLEENAVHGSDSRASAHNEIPFFFNALELEGQN